MPGESAVRELIDAEEARRYEEVILDGYATRRSYMSEYFNSIDQIDQFLGGDWQVAYPDGKVVHDKPKIENRVVSKVEDTGYLAGSIMPSIKVTPLDQRDYNNSQKRERVIRYYWQNSELDLRMQQLFMDMIAFGLFALKVWPDFRQPIEERFPIFRRVNPRHLLPPMDFLMNGDHNIHDCIVHKYQKLRDLQKDYPDQWARLNAVASKKNRRGAKTESIVVLEYWGDEAIVRVAMVSDAPSEAVTLDAYYNETGKCPVIIGARPTAMPKYTGKVEQMIPALTAENRLFTYMLDYADQMVYAPVTYKGDVRNPGAFGPNALINLGREGEMGRLPPATTNTEVFQLASELERHSRMAGNLPQARAGAVAQSQASAAFVEATLGGLTTEVATYQLVMQNVLRRANVVAQKQDVAWCDARKTIQGLARNSSFRERYVPSELLKDTANWVDYGAGAGLDKHNAFILINQQERSGYVTKRFVRENLDGVEDAAQMEKDLIEEQMLQIMLAGMFQQAQMAANIAPLAEFYDVLQREKNPLMALDRVVAASVDVQQKPGPEAGGPGGQNAAAEQQALERGGIPGRSPNVPAQPGAIPPTLEQAVM